MAVPVSYTHLEVYKRQTEDDLADSHVKKAADRADKAVDRAEKAADKLASKKAKPKLKPVSYTHLSV